MRLDRNIDALVPNRVMILTARAMLKSASVVGRRFFEGGDQLGEIVLEFGPGIGLPKQTPHFLAPAAGAVGDSGLVDLLTQMLVLDGHAQPMDLAVDQNPVSGLPRLARQLNVVEEDEVIDELGKRKYPAHGRKVGCITA